MSDDPLLLLRSNTHRCLEVIETERGLVAPGAGLILKQLGEGRCEERALLADSLPDRRLAIAISQGGGRSFG